MMEKEEIKKILPHREPLLLVDRVTELQLPDRIEAEVDIQKDWQIFQGHFPEQPILPGIYIMESMAQTADILLLLSEQNRGKLPLFFSGKPDAVLPSGVSGSAIVSECTVNLRRRKWHV